MARPLDRPPRVYGVGQPADGSRQRALRSSIARLEAEEAQLHQEELRGLVGGDDFQRRERSLRGDLDREQGELDHLDGVR
jgi:hypothetical protein